MSDLISRQDAIDEAYDVVVDGEVFKVVQVETLLALPSAQPVIPHRNYKNCNIYWCDCGWFLKNKDQTPNYCPNCGKRIEWGDEE